MTTTLRQIHDPEGKLAALVNKDLGTNIDPKAMRMFLLHRWDFVQMYSHAVHEQGGAPSTQTTTLER
jgi:hypothetical protein